MDVTVVVATFGDDLWERLAWERAVPSVEALGVPFVTAHSDTLQTARNHGLAEVDTEFVCFLDADDELEPGYFDAMAEGTADLRAPKVRYMVRGYPNRLWMPQVAGHRHACEAACLMDGNWLCIGTVARTDIVRSVGGFREWPMYEDYCLWLRCYLVGATVEAIPGAVYRAHVRPDSRNRGPDQETKHAVHQAIARECGIPVPA